MKPVSVLVASDFSGTCVLQKVEPFTMELNTHWVWWAPGSEKLKILGKASSCRSSCCLMSTTVCRSYKVLLLPVCPPELAGIALAVHPNGKHNFGKCSLT